MRNRLLNYKPGARGAGVEIVGEHPIALWDTLVKAGRAMSFRGVASANGGDPEQDEDDDVAEDSDEPLFPAPNDAARVDAFVSGIEAATSSQQADKFLDTRLGTEALSKRLRRLSETAQLTQQEQGVDTLFLALGFLTFFEEERSEEARLAPLLLVPAALEREGSDRWRLRARDDDPIVNPALVEYLREQHGVTLPPLPEGTEGFEPLAWFREVERLVAQKPRWAVTGDCAIGIFSFQKFVMHEDLKRNAAVFVSHEVVGQLATRSGGGTATPQLPDDVAAMDLDTSFAPERTSQVVDADSSQLRALAAVERGHHLVIQGPPGTGKSQTITNLIAGALAAGRTVLFVAEKQAALNVVFNRLKRVGLGTFCFELHSSKANKGAVVRELARTLDETLRRPPVSPYDPARLARARDELSAYAQAVHVRVKPLGRSVYVAVGRLSALDDAPATRVVLKTAQVTGSALQAAIEQLGRVSAAAARVGDVAAHPWRDMGKDSLDLSAREVTGDALSRLSHAAPELVRAFAEVAEAYGLPPNLTPVRVAALIRVAEVIDASPGVEAAIAGNSAWRTIPAAAQALLERGRALAAAEAQARSCLKVDSTDASLAAAADIASRYGTRLLRFVVPGWWSARRTLKRAVRSESWAGTAPAAAEVHAAAKAAAERDRLRAETAGSTWFGVRWRGPDSNWDELGAVALWLTRFRTLVDEFGLGDAAMAQVKSPTPSAKPLKRAAGMASEVLALWRTCVGACGWESGYLEDSPLADFTERIQALAASPTGWREWTQFAVLRRDAIAGIAEPVVREAGAGRIQWADLARAFERRFYEWWISEQVETTEALRRFRGSTHEDRIAEFRDLDRQILEHHREALVAKLREQGQERLRDRETQQGLALLREQLARQRGHKPVRQLIQDSFGAIQAVKPCFLMSPMTVSLCLDPSKHRFDLVVFDEASQVTPEDALGAIGRGTQLVVVGDAKQLPPTNFFAVQSGQVVAQVGADGVSQFSDLDSVLELASAAGFAGAPLRWHYRSRHEGLIAFSNRNFYDSSLFTFPSADTDCSHRGVQLVYLERGCYEGQGVNRTEARQVVEAVVQHAREHPGKSLCVGTFSLPQQLAVQDVIELRRRADPALDEFLSLDRPEPFFVKNLESIQGDERDTVILSITYGRGTDGRVALNFGPINGQNGWRRLNVLTTRARERMLVFSSMRSDDIDVTRAQSGGAALLKAFLKFAETGELAPGPVVDATAQAESPLEAEVLAALVRAGIQVQPQVGVAGYRIDIGIVDPEVPGRFVCGIECDGVAYHAAECARDRDRLREEHLRRLGWRLHRVWSLDWWHDRAGQTQRLLDLIARSKEEARLAPDEDGPGANAAPPAAQEPDSGVAEDLATAVTSGDAAARRSVVSPPAFAPYVVARPRQRTNGIVEAADRHVADALEEILRTEGPLHEDDLRLRVLAAFGHARSGWRITERIHAGLRALAARSGIETAAPFWRLALTPALPRSRATTGIPAERISTWEYEAAVLAVLGACGSLSEGALVAAVRDSFGFGAASASLRTGVHDALGRLSAAGRVGIGGSGIALVGGTDSPDPPAASHPS